MSNRINYRGGHWFGLPMRLGGYLFLLIGATFVAFGISATFTGHPEALLWGLLLGGFPLGFGGVAALSKTGVLIELDQSRFCEYNVIFGMRFNGNWRKLSTMPYVSVLRKQIVHTNLIGGVLGGGIMTKRNESVYDVVLLNKSHRSKLVLQRYRNADEARQAAKTAAEQLGTSYASYAPKISDKTMQRKARELARTNSIKQ